MSEIRQGGHALDRTDPPKPPPTGPAAGESHSDSFRIIRPPLQPIPKAYSPLTEPSIGGYPHYAGFPGLVCRDCGALVYDSDLTVQLHNEWHERMNKRYDHLYDNH